MFIAAVFTIAKTWKQPKCPSTDEWIKMRYRCTMEYYSASNVLSWAESSPVGLLLLFIFNCIIYAITQLWMLVLRTRERHIKQPGKCWICFEHQQQSSWPWAINTNL